MKMILKILLALGLLYVATMAALALLPTLTS